MKKKVIIIVSAVLLVLLVAYFSGAFYYRDRFLSNVHINETDIGGMTVKEANKKLSKSEVLDKITIKSDTEELLKIDSDKIDYKYLDSPDLPKILDKQNKWMWFSSFFKDSSYDIKILSEYNQDKLKNVISGIEEMDREFANANIAYSDSANEFVIKPHVSEIKLSKEELLNLVDKHIKEADEEVNIEKNIKKPEITANNKELAKAKDQANKLLDLKLKYDFGDREEVVDANQLKNWLTFNGKELDVDGEKAREYVVELAKKYDTFGKNRQFKSSTGETITVQGGGYGWMTHRQKTTDELIKHIKEGKDKTIEPVYSYTAAKRESNDIGGTYVEINLNQQMVYLYVDGKLKVKTPTVTGNIAQGHNTPKGVDALTYKQAGAVLRGDGYASPVKYWMPFNGDIGLHDANWRDSFGGDIYKTSGSHGCINLPTKEAKTIFDSVYPGMPVIVY